MTEDFLHLFHDPDVWVTDMTTGKVADITDDNFVGASVLKDANANIDLGPFWSNDSSHVFFVRYVQTGKGISAPALLSVPAEGGTPQQVGEFAPSTAKFPVYLLVGSPDSSKMAFLVDTALRDQGKDGVWLADADGQNPQQLLVTDAKLRVSAIEFSADGRYLIAIGPLNLPATRPEQSPVRVIPVDGSGASLVDKDKIVLAAVWAPSGHGLAYLVSDFVHPDTSGLYLTAEPGQPGRLVLPGLFFPPSPLEDRLTWGADNTILLASRGGRPLNVVHLGQK
jgi:dipeptidyl aminopeptidase/acylaminoacyl peptidase